MKHYNQILNVTSLSRHYDGLSQCSTGYRVYKSRGSCDLESIVNLRNGIGRLGGRGGGSSSNMHSTTATCPINIHLMSNKTH
jgi:hypothetical protein